MIEAAAAGWGRCLGRYGQRIVNERSVGFIAERPLPPTPLILVCWHEHNLIALAAYRLMRKGPAFTFVPKGIRGAAVAGWIGASGMVPLPINGDAQDGIQLRRMTEALRQGGDVLVAVDGPSGPRRRVRPGALWLAEATGVPVVAFGCAAEPAFRFPRWDRHLVPLPGARIAAALSDPMAGRRDLGRRAAEEQLSRVLDAMTERATIALKSQAGREPGASFQPGSARTWK